MTPEDHADLQALGMTFVPNFISALEQVDLLARLIFKDATRNFSHSGRSCVQRYGSRKPYNNHMISEVIPAHFEKLCQRLVEQKLLARTPDSVTVNEYLKGHVIQPHIDALGGGPVVTVLSLGTPADMRFRRKDVEKCYTVNLEPCSLIQMRGDLRYKWTHEILPVADTRYSVVFRCSQECEDDA
ncbi:hypothetical protein EBZ39_08450 [bacterium]|nr:hypothetical protein [bacterium]